jgi:hypothetical protein
MATASGSQMHIAAFPYAVREGRLVSCLPRDSVGAHAILPASDRDSGIPKTGIQACSSLP